MSKGRINIVLIFFAILFALLINISGIILTRTNNYEKDLKNTVEQQYRESARMHLNDARNRFLTAIKNKEVDPNDFTSVSKWCNENFAGLRNGTKTSDGFVIEVKSGLFIEDESPDCTKIIGLSQGRYLKDEPKMHKYPKLAQAAIAQMKLGLNTKYGDNYYWNFDGAPEWLEWVYIPDDPYSGINEEPRTVQGIDNPKFKKYIFVLGTQSDEALQPYQPIFNTIDRIRKLVYTLLGIVFVLIVSELFHLVYLKFHRFPNLERR